MILVNRSEGKHSIWSDRTLCWYVSDLWCDTISFDYESSYQFSYSWNLFFDVIAEELSFE